MNVLVTGGTGFVGREILRELKTTGHEIHLLARNPESAEARKLATQFDATLREGNMLDAASLKSACADTDAVIHLVGIISEVGEQTFENVHTHGTENIVRAAEQAGVQRFLQMSALGTRPNAIARYHQSKWAAEEIVRRSTLESTIFRPSIIYGPDDGFVNLFAKIIRLSPIVPVMGNGESKFQPIAVECVALAFVKALSEPRAGDRVFDLAGPEVFTFNQIVDQILVVMKCRRLKLHLPLGIARVQAALLEFIFPWLLRKAPPLNRDQLLMLREDNVGDEKPADELFGLKQGSFQKGIARYL